MNVEVVEEPLDALFICSDSNMVLSVRKRSANVAAATNVFCAKAKC